VRAPSGEDFTKQRRIFFDFETGGLDPEAHAITQAGMIAVRDEPGYPELERFECKLLFPEAAATAEALDKSCYDPEVWANEAMRADEAADLIAEFIKKHATKRHQTPKWKGHMALLAGYKVDFDQGFLRAFFKRRGVFAPTWPLALDVMQLAMWFWRGHTGVTNNLGVPSSFKLVDVMAALEIEPEGDAHDAMVDCAATVEVARRLTAKIEDPWSEEEE
jgi:DNA polymerase III epsilon subunit-like protein